MLNVQLCNGGDSLFVCCCELYIRANAVDGDVLDSKNVGHLRKRGVHNSHAGLTLFPADILPISSCCTDMESK